MNLPFTNHPQINAVVQRFNEEEHHFSKIHRMIDLIEVIIKTHTAYAISDYFRIKDISENIKGLLANGLITPSLGLWKIFCSAVLEDIMIKKILSSSQFKQILNLISKEQRDRVEKMYHLEGDNYHLNKFISLSDRSFLRKKVFKRNNYEFSEKLFLDSFIDYYFTWENDYLNEKISNGTAKIDNVISLRNKYAHGASPSKHICEKDLETYFPILQEMLEQKWLYNTTIIVIDEEGNTIPFPESLEFKNEQETSFSGMLSVEKQKSLCPFIPYLVRNDQSVLSLFPILLYKYLEEGDGHSLVFFNDAKKYESSSISLLDYSNGIHIHEQEAFENFQQIINIAEWKSLVTEDFQTLIKQRTENFYGREKEQKIIKKIIHTRDRGFLGLFGDPGIGKSSIMAQMVHSFKNNHTTHVIEYFFERGSRISTFLTTIHDKINALKNTSIPIGRTVEEMQTNLNKKLSDFSLSSDERKLVFFFDGLDTGLQEDPTLLHFLPTRVYRNVFFVFSSRRTSESLEYYEGLPSQYINRYDLRGMNDENIRGLLYKSVNKYKITEDYIQALTDKSDGNPLYMTLLCDAIENGEIPLNNKSALPQLTKTNQFDHFYHQLLNRYARKPHGQELLTSLYTFAAAKDYLSAAHLEHMSEIEACDVRLLLTELNEVLSEHPNKRGYFQLFHESLREFLLNKERHLIHKRVKKILEFCKNRNNLPIYDSEVLCYIYKHYTNHLLDCIESDHFPKEERLLYQYIFDDLINDDSFIEAQIKTTGEYGYSFSFYKQAFQLYQNRSYNRIQETKQKMVYLAVKAAQLHLRLSNSPEEILSFNQFHNLDELRLILERLKYLKADEQAIMYIYLLFQCLQAQEPWKKCVDLILESLNNQFIIDPSIMNWNDIIPKNIYVWILVKCYLLKADYHSLLLRFQVTHNHELQEIDHLIKVYYGEHQSLMNEVVLNMVGNNSFVVAYFLKQVEFGIHKDPSARIERILMTLKEYCCQSSDYSERSSLLAMIAKMLQDLGLNEHFQYFAAEVLNELKANPALHDKPLLLLNIIEEWQEGLSSKDMEYLYNEFILFINDLPQNLRSLGVLIEVLITLANLNRAREVILVRKLIERILKFIPMNVSTDDLIGDYLKALRGILYVSNTINRELHKLQISLIGKIFNWMYKDNELKMMIKILSCFGDFASAQPLLPKIEDHYSRSDAFFYIMEEEFKRGGFKFSLKIFEEQIMSDEGMMLIFRDFGELRGENYAYKQFIELFPDAPIKMELPTIVSGVEVDNRELISDKNNEYRLSYENSLRESSIDWNQPIFHTPLYQQYRKNYNVSFDEVNKLFFPSGSPILLETRVLNLSVEHLLKTIHPTRSLPVFMTVLDSLEYSPDYDQSITDKTMDVTATFSDEWELIVQKVDSYYRNGDSKDILSTISKELQIRTFVNTYGKLDCSYYYLELICFYVIFHDLRKKNNQEPLLRISKEFMKLFKRIIDDGNKNMAYVGIEEGNLIEDFAVEYMILGESTIAAHLADFTINPYSSDFSEKWQDILRKTCNLLVMESEWNGALKMVSKIKDVSYQEEMRKQIAIGLTKSDNLAVKDIYQIINKIKDVDKYYETIVDVAVSFFCMDNKAEYEKLVRLLPAGPYLESLFSKVAIMMATQGQAIQAYQLTREISDKSLGEQTILELAQLMLQQKKYKEIFLFMGMSSNEAKLVLLAELLVGMELAEVPEIVEYLELYSIPVEVKEFFYKKLLTGFFQKKEYKEVFETLIWILHRVIENPTLLGQTLYQLAFFNTKLLNPDSQIYADIQKVVDVAAIVSPVGENVGINYGFHNIAEWIETLNPLLKLSIQTLENKVMQGEISNEEFDSLVSKYLTIHP